MTPKRPPTNQTIRSRRLFPNSAPAQLHKTIQLIGQGIKEAGTNPEIRFHAAQLAAKAPWKDYMGQLQNLYDDFLTRWTYVKDPVGQEALQLGKAAWLLTMGAGTPGKGYGDCDDATISIAGMARAIGLEPRIVIMASPKNPRQPSHVYPEVHIPGKGWIPVDPVAQPRVPFGRAAPAAWRKRYDLNGKEIKCPWRQGDQKMARFMGFADADVNQYPDHDLTAYGLAGYEGDGIPMVNWNDEVVAGFGAFLDDYGQIDNPGYLAEVDTITADGLAVTPILELGIGDYQHMIRYGRPYVGMCAIGDDGAGYQYQEDPQIGGFFKKIFKRIKKRVKKVVKKVIKGAKRLIKKLPGGKYLVKIHDKITKFSKKLIKPLAKLVGPLARKLAPIAALIPGYGTAVAAALHTTGKISQLIEEHGVKKDKKSGRPKFKNAAHATAFKAALERQADLVQRSGRQRQPQKPGHIPRGTAQHAAKLQSMGVRRPLLPQQQRQRA